MRIAILNRDRCQPNRCNKECEKFCPRARVGDEIITFDKHGRPIISEELCVGCGICINKCPFDAIQIIGLPEELQERETHRYGVNGFVLFGLPVPRRGRVTGVLGSNGIGKSTAVNILSNRIIPSLGHDIDNWEDVVEAFAGTELYNYFSALTSGEKRSAQKPQYVDLIPREFSGTVRELLAGTDERGLLPELTEQLGLSGLLERDISRLSGGELQRVAIAACLARKADFYFLDEITPYLDIFQRMNVARIIRSRAKDDTMLVVEHDLAILDVLADVVHVMYGEPGAYGVVTLPKVVRVGINQYLEGYLPEENMRIREQPIKFSVRAPRPEIDYHTLVEFREFTRTYDEFSLHVGGGELRTGEVVGVVGPNGIGKTTMMRILSGVEETDDGPLELDLTTSYKPQYLSADEPVMVAIFLRQECDDFDTALFRAEVREPMSIDELLEKDVSELSGGELQRVAIAACLGRKAELYVIDEPSAHLDVEQRSLCARTIRRWSEKRGVSTIVVDHDIYLVDLLSDRLLVFERAVRDARGNEPIPGQPCHHLPARRGHPPPPGEQAGQQA